MLGLGFKTLPRTCTRIFFSINQQTTYLFGFVKIFFPFQKIESFFFLSENIISHNRNNKILKTKEIFFSLFQKTRSSFFFPLENKNNQIFFQKNRISQNLKNKFLFFSLQSNQTPTMNFPFFFRIETNHQLLVELKKFCLKIVRKLLERINKTKITTSCRNLGKHKPNVWTFQAS